MQKKANRKLVLSRETLRTLTQDETFGAKGGQTEDSICSNPTFTCDSCFGCTTSRNTNC